MEFGLTAWQSEDVSGHPSEHPSEHVMSSFHERCRGSNHLHCWVKTYQRYKIQMAILPTSQTHKELLPLAYPGWCQVEGLCDK